MPSLSTQGIGSGLDIAGIVNKIMTIERQPWVKMGTNQVEMQAQLSAYGQLKSVVSQLQTTMTELSDAAKFKATKATSSDSKILTATATAEASRGSYSIEVKRLSETHRMAGTTAFVDTTAAKVGVAGDTLVIDVGSKSFTVEIGNKTLDEIRTAINSAVDNAGVTASIIKDSAGHHLSLSAKSSGAANFMAVKYRTLTDLATDQPDRFGLTNVNTDRNGVGGFTAADLDAEIKLENTYTVTSATNTVSDAISGLSMELVTAGTVTLNVARDDGKIQSAVQQLVSSYNAVFKLTGDLKNKVLKDERGSLLNIESQFRDALHVKSGTSKAFKFLAEIGVTNGANGTGLALNTTIFQEALNKDPEGIASMFADAQSGAALRFRDLAKSLLGAGGVLPARETSMKARIDANTTERANLEFRLGRKEASLNKQFNRLDSLIAGLNTTSSYLTAQFAQFTANKDA